MNEIDSVLEKIGFPPIKEISWSLNSITDEEGGWLAGIFAGEGTFNLMPIRYKNLMRYDPLVSISQRSDNSQMIIEIIRIWQLEPSVCRVVRRGYTENPDTYPSKPVLQLCIRDTPTIYQRIVPTFTKYNMRAKKQSDFLILVEAISILVKRRIEHRFNREYTDEERSKLTELHRAIRDVKKFSGDNNLPFPVQNYIANNQGKKINVA